MPYIFFGAVHTLTEQVHIKLDGTTQFKSEFSLHFRHFGYLVSINGQYCQDGLQLVSSVNLPVKGDQSLSLVKNVVQIDLPLQANPLIMINFSPKFYYYKCRYDQHGLLMVQSQFSRIFCLCFFYSEYAVLLWHNLILYFVAVRLFSFGIYGI